MALSYTGRLFRRIVVSSGYTFGNSRRVSYVGLMVKFNEYSSRDEFVYRRGADGKWHCSCRPEDDNEFRFWEAIRWLEKNGYIKVSWRETVRVSRLLDGSDSFIKLTEKGLAAAPSYLKQKEDFPA